jgi:hypothetical protein
LPRSGAAELPHVAPTEYVNLTNNASSWTQNFVGIAWPVGPFSHIQVQIALTNFGDPWDRADWIYLNDVTLLDVTTLENGSDNNHVQSFTVNITDYESLFAGPGYLWWEAMPSWISPCDTEPQGCWTGVLSFQFTPGPAPPALPSIVPVLSFATVDTISPWVNGTLRVPGSYARAEAVVFQEGQGNDEFWYAQPFASRELEWQWNNRTVLAVTPLPFVNSGGALGGTNDLYEWNGTPAPGTGARPAVDVDLTPWLSMLNESVWYNLTVVDNENSWQIGLALFLWAASDARTFGEAGSVVDSSFGSRAGSVQGYAFANFSEPFAAETYNLSWADYLNVSSTSFDVSSSSFAVDRVVSSSVTLERTASFRTVFDLRVDGSGAVHVDLFANWTNVTTVLGNRQDVNLTEQQSFAWTINGSSGGLASTEFKATTSSSRGSYSAPPATFATGWGEFQNRTATNGVGTSAAPSSVRYGGTPVTLPGHFVVAPRAGVKVDGPVPVDLLTAPDSAGPAQVSLGDETMHVPSNDTVNANSPSLRNGTYSLNVSGPTSEGPGQLSVALLVTGWVGPYIAPLTAVASVSGTLGEAPWTVSFTGTAQGGAPPYLYAWTFGDGGTAYSENAIHRYASSGNFVAELNVTDSAGRRTQTEVDVFAFSALTVSLTSSVSSWTVGQTATLTAAVSGGYGPFNYSWAALPSSCTAGGESGAVCTPTAGGLISIELTVNDSLGRDASAWFNTTVGAAPSSVGAAVTEPELVVGGTVALAAVLVLAVLVLRGRRRGRRPGDSDR